MNIKFETVNTYLQFAKPNDIIVLGGYGILDGTKVSNKYDTYKVQKETTKEKLVLKSYKGRKKLTLQPDRYDQQLLKLSIEFFNSLPA